MDNGKAEKLENLSQNSSKNWNVSAPAHDLGNIGKKAIFSGETEEAQAKTPEIEIITLSDNAPIVPAGNLPFDPKDIYPNGYDISPVTVKTVQDVITSTNSPADLYDAYRALNDIYGEKDSKLSGYADYIKHAGKKAA